MSQIAINSPVGTGRIIQEVPIGYAADASDPAVINAPVADTGVQQVFAPTFQPASGGRKLLVTPTGTVTNLTAVSIICTGIALVEGLPAPTTETLPAFSAGSAAAKTSVNTWLTISSLTQPPLGASPPTAIPCNIEYGEAALTGTPALGSGITIASAADTGVTQSVPPVLQPDVARTVVATPSGTTANVTAVSCTIVGIGPSGEQITEVLPAFTAAQATAVESVNAFSRIISISQPAIGTAVTVTYTCGAHLGLPGGFALNTNTVLAAYLNGVKEATAPTVTLSATPSKTLVQLNSALNATPVRVDFYYPS